MSNPLTGNRSPEDAIPVALDCANTTPEFTENGHLYTTYKVAILAGIEVQNSLVLAYFSQYPDIDPNYNAAKLWLDKWIPGGFDNQWIEFIFDKVHSLHGGDYEDIKKRKIELEKLIQHHLSKGEYWKAGLFIHSLGDAYAHTKNELNSDSEKAYGVLIGHGIDSILGKDPDDINRRIVREKYIAYVQHLFSLLKTEFANKNGLDEYLNNIRVDQCVNKTCPAFQVLGETKGTELDRFIICMNNNMRNLTEDEVRILFKNI